MKNFEFIKLSIDDIPLLHSWLKRPHLTDFFQTKNLQDLESFKKKFQGDMAASKMNPYIVMLQGKPIGYIQSYAVDEKTFGINQFIAVPEFVNKGLGSMFVKEFTDELLMNKKIKRVITDPSILNLRAQKAYEKAGFKKLETKSGDEGVVVMMEKKTKIKKAS